MALITSLDLEAAQNKVFYYQQELTSKEFNRVFSKTLPTGIYEGGLFTRVNDTSFTIDPFSVVIEDRNGVNDVAVRIRTTVALTATIENNESYPFIVARYSWETGKDNSLDILQVSETTGSAASQLGSTDLILGKLNFVNTGGTISLESEANFVDYTSRSNSVFSKEVLKNNFNVRAAQGIEDKSRVYISSGTIKVKDGFLNIVGQESPIFSPTSTTARTDYVYIDTSGNIQVEEGGAAGLAEPYYGRKVIAEIRRDLGRSTIFGSEIFNLSETPLGTIDSDTLEFLNNSVYFQNSLTVEEALNEVWEKAIREVIEESTPKTFRNINGLKIDTGSGKDIIVIKPKDVGTTSKILTLTTSLGLTANRTVYFPNADVTLLEGTQVTIANINQTIDGIKTFSKIPIVPANSTENTGAAQKLYVDNVQTNLTTHQNLLTTSGATTIPHGIKQGSGNGFDADKIDGAHLSTLATLGISDSLVVSQKAIKSYVDTQITSTVSTISSSGNAKTATQLQTARTLNGVSFNGTSAITIPANLTLDDSTNTDLYLAFAAVNSSGNKSLKQSSKLMFNPLTGELKFPSIYLTSSREKKDNIKDFTSNALKIINSTKIVNYTYKEDLSKNVHIGLIAEDAPIELTSKDKKTFAMSDTVGVLLKAVQELSEKVEGLFLENQELYTKLEELTLEIED